MTPFPPERAAVDGRTPPTRPRTTWAEVEALAAILEPEAFDPDQPADESLQHVFLLGLRVTGRDGLRGVRERPRLCPLPPVLSMQPSDEALEYAGRGRHGGRHGGGERLPVDPADPQDVPRAPGGG